MKGSSPEVEYITGGFSNQMTTSCVSFATLSYARVKLTTPVCQNPLYLTPVTAPEKQHCFGGADTNLTWNPQRFLWKTEVRYNCAGAQFSVEPFLAQPVCERDTALLRETPCSSPTTLLDTYQEVLSPVKKILYVQGDISVS